ncbi:MAG: hypothetical protein MK098_08615 [Marinovum sp.]|nr:hypothetical protein [Marinovum sp.]
MCVICSATQTFDPGRHAVAIGMEGGVGAELLENNGDATASIATTYSMAVGDTYRGEIDTAFEDDWVAITLQAGMSYLISLLGSPSSEGTLNDPLVRLYDSSGNFVSQNDDGGVGLESASIIRRSPRARSTSKQAHMGQVPALTRLK